MPASKSIGNFYWLCAAVFGFQSADALAAKSQPEHFPLVKVAEFHLKNARLGAAASVLDKNIYVFGGDASGAVTRVERINCFTGQSVQMTDKLVPRRYHSVIEHEGKFYLFGGQGYGLPGRGMVDYQFERAVEIYDPATDSVAAGPVMSRARYSMAAAKLGDKAYFIGGTKMRAGSIAQTNETDIYDFRTGTWSVGLPMPTPRESKAVVVDGFLLVPGGYSNRRGIANVEMFVPHENVWKALPPLGRAVSSHSLVFLGEHLFLFGDYDDLGTVLAYNLRNRETLKFNAGFKGARHTTAVVCQQRIYVIGGNTLTESGTELDLIQVFELNPGYKGK